MATRRLRMLSAMLFTSVFAVSLLIAAPAYTAIPQSPVQFRWEGSRLLAVVDRRSLETDFIIQAQRTAVTGPMIGGTRLASGALQVRRVGDSLVLLTFAGTRNGKFQYRRRAVMPILRVTPGTYLVDGVPFWYAVESAATEAAGLSA